MAAAPSASALSAVLRCRGNIWTRNPPAKRPASAAHGRGLTGGAPRGSPAARSGSNRASPRGERAAATAAAAGRSLAVRFGPGAAGGDASSSTENRKSRPPKLSPPPGDARWAAPGVQNARACGPPGRPARVTTIHTIRRESTAAHICKTPSGQDTVLKLSVRSRPRGMEHEGRVLSCPVLTGWSALRDTCSSLTALVSKILLLKFGGLCSSSTSSSTSSTSCPDAPPHLLCPQDESSSCSQALQAHERASSESSSGSGQKITQEGPD